MANGNSPWWQPELSCVECQTVIGDRQFECKTHPDAALVGNTFYGAVIGFQEAECENALGHYLVQSDREQVVKQGSRENSELVTVMPGEVFSISECLGLPLRSFIGFSVWVQTQRQSIANTKTNGEVPYWSFTIKVKMGVTQLLKPPQRKEPRTSLTL